MLRLPVISGQKMGFHLLSDVMNHQKKGFSILRQSSYCSQLATRSMSTKQAELRRHPVPPLKDTLTRFARSVKPLLSSSELETTNRHIKDFEECDGQDLQKILELRAKNTDNWLAEWWITVAYLGYRLPVVVHSNPALIFPRQKFKGQDEFLQYAARLTFAALTYKEDIDSDKIPVDMMGKEPLDMTQYKKIYGTCRIPAPKVDKMLYEDKSNPVRHIAVVHNNQFFKVNVISEDCKINSPEMIFEQLKCVVDSSEEPSAPLGILTSEHRDTWAEAYCELMEDETNCESVKTIQTSLFLLCLDGDYNVSAPNVPTSDALKIEHGGGSKGASGNRWFDKTIQIIVGCGGEVGINVEHSPAEAVPMAMLMNYCLDFLGKLKPSCGKADDFPEPEKLEFNLSKNTLAAIDVAGCNLDELVEDTEFSSCAYPGYGKNQIKEFKLSPDSYIQMALQFAFYRLHNEPAAHYESAGTRLFYLGRTECIRSCSIESVHFAKTMLDPNCSNEDKKEALLAAIKGHKDYATQAALGMGVDRHLLGLRLAAGENGYEAHPLFKDPSYVRSTHYKITSSQVAGKGNSVMVYGPVVPDGYASCYNPLGNTINFGLAAFRSCETTNLCEFQEALFESFDDMQKVLAVGHKAKSKL